MRILSRYVLREYLVPLAYCLGGFISIYVLFELFGSFARLRKSGLGFGITVEYFCAYLAPYFEWIAPAALMLAALYTMWSFCRHSEIIAMRANGIGFMTIVRPIVLTAAAMAALVWLVNDCYVPRHAQWARAMKTEQFDLAKVGQANNLVYRNSKEFRIWKVDRLLNEDGTRLADVRVTQEYPGGGTQLWRLTSPCAEYLDGEWWFRDATVQHYDATGREIASPTPELDGLKLRSFPSFREKPSDLLMHNRDWQFYSIRDRLRYLRNQTGLSDDQRRQYRYDVWSKILAPLACIVITLFAIPAGIASGRQSVFRGILGALGQFFAFYTLVIGCKVFVNFNWLDPIIAAVLPYVVFFALGIWSFHKNR